MNPELSTAPKVRCATTLECGGLTPLFRRKTSRDTSTRGLSSREEFVIPSESVERCLRVPTPVGRNLLFEN
jgi:hypothetical protein